MQLFSAEAKIFLKNIAHDNMKSCPQKLLEIGTNFFSALPIGSKPAQISIFVPCKLLTVELMYNDFEHSCPMFSIIFWG